jgi:hypothetical protein
MATFNILQNFASLPHKTLEKLQVAIYNVSKGIATTWMIVI